MAVDVLKGNSFLPTSDSLNEDGAEPRSAPARDKYGDYGLGPQHQKKYYLRRVTSFDNNLIGKRTPTPKVQKSVKTEPERKWIIIPDLIRSLKVPSRPDPSGKSIIIDKTNFERIKSAARVLSVEEKDDILYTCLQRNQNKSDASLRRREYFKAIDREKGKLPKKFEEIDLELKEHKDALLKRATDMRLEQEEEMKDLDKRITAIKNAAIHQKQIGNKQVLDATMQEEERRMESIMEDERVTAIEREKARQLKLKELGKKYGEVLQLQIKDNEQIRQVEKEHLFEEKKELLKSMASTLDDFDEEFRKKRQKQKLLKQGLDDCVDGLMHRILEDKWQQKMREKEAELYANEKERMLKARNDDLLRVQRLRQEKIDRNCANFEKMIVDSVDWHDLRVKRDEDAEERKWRLKQKEEQLKLKQKTEALKRMREENLALKQKIAAVYLQEDKEDYQKLIRDQKEGIIKEREMERRKKAMKKDIAKVQLKQIEENEASRIRDRAQIFADGVKALDQKEKTMKELKEMKKNKLEEIKKRCPEIPEEYIQFVENKVQITPVLKMRFDQKISKFDR
uniref:Cilia- and flagella-associated protein 45 n=1 Tax=Strigamia maritima TaxID=126957 RepID=T1JMH1_STRMM